MDRYMNRYGNGNVSHWGTSFKKQITWKNGLILLPKKNHVIFATKRNTSFWDMITDIEVAQMVASRFYTQCMHGFRALQVRTLKQGCLWWVAPPCSTWIFLARGSTGRTYTRARGVHFMGAQGLFLRFQNVCMLCTTQVGLPPLPHCGHACRFQEIQGCEACQSSHSTCDLPATWRHCSHLVKHVCVRKFLFLICVPNPKVRISAQKRSSLLHRKPYVNSFVDIPSDGGMLHAYQKSDIPWQKNPCLVHACPGHMDF